MEKYNGWANRSTWAVHLWITNEYWTYQVSRRNKFNAEQLELWFTTICKELPLMREDCEPLDEVDWKEVSEALLED